MNGVINIYKERGYTSQDVVAKLRGILKQKKIGHTGTLDPDAEGVLPICVGNATKLFDILTDRTKEYETVLLLGKKTDTEDISGTVLTEDEVCCSNEEVYEAIMSFVGDIMQVPPMYSALKVDGKRLYELAREGKTIERKSRPVTIISISDIHIDIPISFVDATLGKTIDVPTVYGDVELTIPAGTQPGKMLRLKGKGLPANGGASTGDLIVNILVYVPEKLNDKERKAIECLRDEANCNPADDKRQSLFSKLKYFFAGGDKK